MKEEELEGMEHEILSNEGKEDAIRSDRGEP